MQISSYSIEGETTENDGNTITIKKENLKIRLSV